MERFQNGMVLNTPPAYDVEHFYPAEVELGRRALELIRRKKGIDLPDSEATNIALHLVNGEMEHSDMHATLTATQVIRDITEIVEQTPHLKLDTSSFNYSRFVMHIRYLLQRMEEGTQEVNGMSITMRQLIIQHPDIYRCTQKVSDYLFSKYHWKCNQDEMLYLFMHINRLKERSQQR